MNAIVGTDLLLLPTTAFILLNERDEVLMLRRSDNGAWCCPGGILDLGETVRENALRELFEETGLTVGECSLFGVFAGDDFRMDYPNGDRTAVVQNVFVSRDVHGDARIDEESTDMRWFPHGDLPTPIAPTHAGFLRYLAQWIRGDITIPIVV
jgi:8-oxo-dGTP pyrophosphatase MutT (NUDIX family)